SARPWQSLPAVRGYVQLPLKLPPVKGEDSIRYVFRIVLLQDLRIPLFVIIVDLRLWDDLAGFIQDMEGIPSHRLSALCMFVQLIIRDLRQLAHRKALDADVLEQIAGTIFLALTHVTDRMDEIDRPVVVCIIKVQTCL